MGGRGYQPTGERWKSEVRESSGRMEAVDDRLGQDETQIDMGRPDSSIVFRLEWATAAYKV